MIYSFTDQSRREIKIGTFIHAIDVSPDGRTLVTLGGAGILDQNPGLVQTWNIATGEKLKSYVGHRGFVSDGEFTADGRHIVTGGRNDRTLRVWDVASAKEVARVTSDSHCFGFLAVSPDHQYVATGGGTHGEFGKYEDDGDNRLFFWSFENIRARKELP